MHGVHEALRVQAAMLKEWVRGAHADITLVEVLAGRALAADEDVASATDAAVLYDPADGRARLKRPASAGFVPSMRAALQAAAPASTRLRTLCVQVAETAHSRALLLEKLKVRLRMHGRAHRRARACPAQPGALCRRSARWR
jgi:hypothetical protein